ncbi:hypothetical protein V1515DRAFT_592903 [Lipomyces mesembrius]
MTTLLPFMLALSLLVTSATAHGYITNFCNPTEQTYGECIRPYVLYHEKEPVTAKARLVSVTATPSSQLHSLLATVAAVFPDLTCSSTLTPPTATMPALASTTSTVSSARRTAVFPDLTCSTSSTLSSAATTFLTAVTTENASQHIRTQTVTLDPVTVHATVTISVYKTEYVTDTVTVGDINIAY